MKKLINIFAIVLFASNLSAQNTITTDTILQLTTCAGGNVLVPYDATGNFPFGNVFTAELSNAFGQFTNPVSIGTSSFNLGFIFATIPANTNFGFLYKIRVVSSNPAVIGTPCPNTLIITQVAQLNQIIATPSDTACIGDTITLTAINPADTYSWSTGDTSAMISVTQSGNYSVTTTDFLGCESDTSKSVVFEMCPVGLDKKSVEPYFDVYPNPSSGKVTISNISNHLNRFDLKIINILGQTVYSQSGIYFSDDLQINISKKGVYFVELSSEIDRLRHKFVIQ